MGRYSYRFYISSCALARSVDSVPTIISDVNCYSKLIVILFIALLRKIWDYFSRALIYKLNFFAACCIQNYMHVHHSLWKKHWSVCMKACASQSRGAVGEKVRLSVIKYLVYVQICQERRRGKKVMMTQHFLSVSGTLSCWFPFTEFP